MGYDPEYFLSHSHGGLSDSFLCVVCHAVYDTPMVLDPCGHSFCQECVASLLDSGHENCPVCRTPMIEGAGVGVPPNRALKDLISNLSIRCMNNPIGEADENLQQHKCSWEGRLADFADHAVKDCPLRKVSCPVAGCDFEGPFCALAQHNADSVALHTDLLVSAKLQSIQEEVIRSMGRADSSVDTSHNNNRNNRLEDMQRELKKKDKELRILKARLLDNWLSDSFFRDWIVSKPPYFRDFCVYRPIKYLTGPISQLIVGIPGPKNTDWEGGLYPLLVTFTPEGYERKEPPKCDFPESFFHPNVYEGNVHVNTLVEFEGSWDPSISLPELFFCIQQLLVHPNHRGSLLTSSTTGILYNPVEYRRAVRVQANKYKFERNSDSGIHNSGSSEFLEGAMVALQGKIDPEYKKPLQSWENERWENLEEVRWKGRRSFQPPTSVEPTRLSHPQEASPFHRFLTDTDGDEAEGVIEHEDDEEIVQLIMTTNSNGSEIVEVGGDQSGVPAAAPRANPNPERNSFTDRGGTMPSSPGQIPIIPGRLRNEVGDPCQCSCCVLEDGRTPRPFLDSTHKMRFIYGEGG